MKLQYFIIPLLCLSIFSKGAGESVFLPEEASSAAGGVCRVMEVPSSEGGSFGAMEPPLASAGGRLVMFWNLENFFDWKIDSLSASPSDKEFSSGGERRWSRKRFMVKAGLIAKSILYIGSKNGRLPDAIGFAEVENRFVLKMLIEETALRKLDYRIVHFDSPDTRGIDCALLYRASVFDLVDALPLRVGSDSTFRTRDILHVHLRDRSLGDDIDILVCHFPSKYGGSRASSPRRLAAARRLDSAADSIRSARRHDSAVNPLRPARGPSPTDSRPSASSSRRPAVRGPLDGGLLVAMGDFNDVPSSEELSSIRSLTCLGTPLSLRGEGSIRYQGHWQLIDLFYVPEEDVPFVTMSVARLPFLLEGDRSHGGEKPLRTYLGPRYKGGVSDHCPVLLAISPDGRGA